MLGKLIGAIAGERIAQTVGGVSGTTGVVLGTAAAIVLRRMGPVGLVAAAAGGYALKRYYEKRTSPVSLAPRPAVIAR